MGEIPYISQNIHDTPHTIQAILYYDRRSCGRTGKQDKMTLEMEEAESKEL
jgi:hypothetical protein